MQLKIELKRDASIDASDLATKKKFNTFKDQVAK